MRGLDSPTKLLSIPHTPDPPNLHPFFLSIRKKDIPLAERKTQQDEESKPTRVVHSEKASSLGRPGEEEKTNTIYNHFSLTILANDKHNILKFP